MMPTDRAQPQRFREQSVQPWHRAVLKVGSSLLAETRGELSTRYALGLAQFMGACHRDGREIVLVSSGAVAAGRIMLHEYFGEDTGSVARQALAALGQTQTVALWQRLLDYPLAQVLLTHDDLRNRRRYVNARSTLRELLAHHVLPVVNENDTVAIEGLTFGDNDNLAAIVAALVDADVLLIATDTDGLYTADPRHHLHVEPVAEVDAATPGFLAMGGNAGTPSGTGGMRTKLEAAGKAAAAGIETLLFNGRDGEVLNLLAHGTLRGTRVRTHQSRGKARKYWLRQTPGATGCIRVDAGAERAIREGGASLLPRGVIAAEGDFRRGDVVEVVAGATGATHRVARGIAQYGAPDVNRIAGAYTRDIKGRLGYSYGETVIHRDDLVPLDAEVSA